MVKNMIFESLLVDLNPLQSAAKYEAAEVAKALLDHEVCGLIENNSSKTTFIELYLFCLTLSYALGNCRFN